MDFYGTSSYLLLFCHKGLILYDQTILHRLKRKMRQKFIKNINKTVSFHYSDVKAPRRALNYLTISTFYRRNG
jgi:hypothetical protein